MTKKTSDPQWKLVWSDEFDRDRVDTTKWDFDIGNGFFDYKTHTWIEGWGNEELQYYTREPESVSVKDSLLTIRAVEESLHGCGYTSARLRTRKRDGTALFSKQYGKFEFRAKVPWGKGMWPALWLLPVDDKYGSWAASGEIDVMEIVGEKPHQTLGTIHFGSTFPERELVTHVYGIPNGSTVADWHIYTVEWEPGEIRWLLDGVRWATQKFGSVEAGDTRTHTLHWMQSLQAMGTPDFSVTADTTLYGVFKRADGQKTYLAYNAGKAPIAVKFSDGKTLTVAPGTLGRL